MRRRLARDPVHPYVGETPFASTFEIDAYLSAERIECLLCGRRFLLLGGAHLLHKHGITTDEYRERFGLRRGDALAGFGWRARRSEAQGKIVERIGLPFRKGDNPGKRRNRPQCLTAPAVAAANAERMRVAQRVANEYRAAPCAKCGAETVTTVAIAKRGGARCAACKRAVIVASWKRRGRK